MAKQNKTNPVVSRETTASGGAMDVDVTLSAKNMKDQMEAPPPPMCSSCRYFSAERANAANGKCRHHAPQPNTNISVLTVWPIVKGDDWCGAYEKKQA